jgi:F0F1-type ATP synthase membrane subunit b/b'
MVIRRRDKSGKDDSRPTYSGLGTRIQQLLLAEEQRDQIISEARQEAAEIVDGAHRQAEEILARARAQAGQPGGNTAEAGVE